MSFLIFLKKVYNPPITESVDDYKMNRLRILRDAYNQVDKNRKTERDAYKTYYDRTHKQVDFALNSKVCVHFHLPVQNKSFKLLPSFEGPYEIVAKLNSVTYRVQNEKRTLWILYYNG